jgi:recombination protein RecR
MAEYMESLQHLAEQFGKLEGVGRKTAMRLAYSVVDMSVDDAAAFADAIRVAKERIHLCPVCQNLTDRELCPVCRDDSRDRSVVCVVADAKAVLAMEKVREYRGVYHVLHGLISPMNGVGPDDIRIRELMSRLASGEIKEVVLATNPDVEGEATAAYISRLIKPMGVKVTRIAHGVPVGGELEYTDEVTLMRAFQGRTEI